MSLSKLIDAEIKRQTMADDQGEWRQYILDHLDYITARTRPSEIDILLINEYRYDLDSFLKEKMSIQGDIAWIVLLLNNLTCDFEFTEPGVFIIPSDELISQLYHSYSTVKER